MAKKFCCAFFEAIPSGHKMKKREKETQAMRSNLDVGDEIVTVGGIVGIIVSVKDDTLVIETGSDRSKIRITRWAVQANVTPKEPADKPAAK